MALSTYSELQSAIAVFLNRTDLTTAIPDFIRLAEGMFNDVLRDGEMVETSTLSLSSGAATLPANALELVYAQASNTTPLEQVSPQQLITLRRSRLSATGTPVYYAIIGRSLRVAPIPTSGSITVDYYAEIEALTDANPSNWLLERNPQLYLYTSLMHAAVYLSDDPMFAALGQTVSGQIVQAVRSSQTLTMDDLKSAGPTLTRQPTSTPLSSTVG